MNTSEIILFVAFVSLVNIQKTSPIKTGDKDFNLFHDNTKSLHIAMNKLFVILKLNKIFKKAPKVQLLLNMHNNFINIIENNNKDNEEIENITDNIPIKDWFHMNEAMQKISFEKIIRKHFPPRNKTNTNNLDNRVSDIILSSLKDFLVKIENLKQNVMDTFIASHNMSNDTNKSVTLPKKKLKNSAPDLKLWFPDVNDTNLDLHRRMFKSKKTKVRKYPFIASIHVQTKFVCAGSIVRKDLVITAASCLQMSPNDRITKKSVSDVLVRVGSDLTTSGGQSIAITEVYFHPFYDSKTLRNNLVVLRLDKQLRFTKKQLIRRIRFDRTGDYLRTGHEITMLGWGARDEKNIPFEFQKLSYANLDLYNLKDCKDVFSTLYVTDSNFCAGFVTEPGGACKRDVGDPAIVGTTLVGIVSFGPPMCGTPDVPTVFTKISLYAPWIDSIADMIPNVDTDQAHQMNNVSIGGTTTIQTIPTTEPLLSTETHVLNYPEEVLLIRQMLSDFAGTNTTMLENFVDDSFNKEIMKAFQLTAAAQPVEKAHLDVTPTYGTTKFATKDPIKEYYIDNNEFADMFKVFQKNIANLTFHPKTAMEPTLPIASQVIKTDIIGRTNKKETQYSSEDYSGKNYESYGEKGLSIEYTTKSYSGYNYGRFGNYYQSRSYKSTNQYENQSFALSHINDNDNPLPKSNLNYVATLRKDVSTHKRPRNVKPHFGQMDDGFRNSQREESVDDQSYFIEEQNQDSDKVDFETEEDN